MISQTIDSGSKLRDAIHRAKHVANTLCQSGLHERAVKLEEYIQHANSLRFSIGIVGQAKRGKSTLINGLLGRNDDILAPIDRFPATNVVSSFSNGIKAGAVVNFERDAPDGEGKAIALDEIKDYACEEYNPENRKGVKLIEVVDNFPLLGQDVVLVDTPGADNALSQVHDIVLLEFLPKLDAVIFLVSADAPLVSAELELLKQVRNNDVRKLLFVMNKVDKMDSAEVEEGLQHNRKALAEVGFSDTPIFGISAKKFYQTSSDEGTEILLQELGKILEGGRSNLIAERLSAMTDRHINESAEQVEAELINSQLTVEEIEKQSVELEQARLNLESNRERAEGKFRTSWSLAFYDFEKELNSIQRKLNQEYSERIEKCPSPQLKDLGGMIHTDVIKRLDELLQPHTDKLGEAINTATKDLQVDVLGIMGSPPREADAIITRNQTIQDSVGTILSGAPALAGAGIVATLPGLVSSAIVASAPTVATATLNPLTWIPAAGTGTAAAGASAAGAAVGAVLSPMALIGTPLLVGYAGLKVFSSWKHKVLKAKNELQIGVKDLIAASIDETRKNLLLSKVKDESIISEFRSITSARIRDAIDSLNELRRKRPTGESVSDLKQVSLALSQL